MDEAILTKFRKFIETYYYEELVQNVKKGGQSLAIDYSQLSKFDYQLGEQLIDNPLEVLLIAEEAIKEFDIPDAEPIIRVRIFNLPKSQNVHISNIRSKHLGKFFATTGLIRQASDVRPRVTLATFQCPSCGISILVEQKDAKFREPETCQCGRKGRFKMIDKRMVDMQRLVVEESPEALQGGEQAKRIAVFLSEDLLAPELEKRRYPGNKVTITGVLKEVPLPLKTGGQSTQYDLVIDAVHIETVEEEFEELEITPEEEEEIKKLAEDPEIYEKLTQSIAPSIYGYENVKEAIIFQLFGGVQKKREDGTQARGDIHIFLVGDPGAGKSEMLRYIATLAPKARYVVGKSATGVGITASVVKDEFLRGWALEAGALVLANKGIACVDELDKMNSDDRSAMHELMEQQCYHHDFQLTFSDGSHRKIGEFVDDFIESNREKVQQGAGCEILNLEKDINILTTDFSNIYPVRISSVSRCLYPNKLVKIVLKNGKDIIVTAEHPCWALKDGKVVTVPAESLKAEDFFPIPRELPIDGEVQHLLLRGKTVCNGLDLSKIIGYHITDGCYELNRGIKNGIQFANKNMVLINDYADSIRNFFKKDPGFTKRGEVYSVRVISKEIVEFMRTLDKDLMEKGIKKKIPEALMKCRREDIRFLLAALFDGDGTVTYQKRNGCRITLITENRELADQVTELLLRFGVRSSIYLDKKFFRVDVCGQENIKAFYENIPILSKHKKERMYEYLQKEKMYRSITDIIPNVAEKIKGIFKKLKIYERNNLGGQIENGHEKHRYYLIKLIKIAEEKLNAVKQAREVIKGTSKSNVIGEQRQKLNQSILSLSKKLKISDYLLDKKEKTNADYPQYQELMLREIDDMLSIEGDLKTLRELALGKIGWSKIRSVSYIDTDHKWVYDVSIEPTHAFVSNNLVLHNSVTIIKANIHASLRAETTILAAANPKFGRFDPYSPIAAQIDLPATLINRFDLIFPIRDMPSLDADEKLAQHVLSLHQKGGAAESKISPKLIRKYIAYAKQTCFPILTDAAIDEIKKFYVELRNAAVGNEAEVKPIPISARQLQALVRLSEASAKVRLSKKVLKRDAIKAIELLRSCMQAVGTDPETGKFDIDRITTGITASQRNKIMTVKKIIEDLENKVGKNIPIADIISAAEAEGVERQKIDEILENLKKKGDIYEPKPGIIQKVG